MKEDGEQAANTAASRFKASSFLPAAAEGVDEHIVPEEDGEPMDEGSEAADDLDGEPLNDDVDGVPLDEGEDVDGAPMEDVDGEPLDDVDGIPMDDDDDLDGAPL